MDVNKDVNDFRYHNLALMGIIAGVLRKTEKVAFFKERSAGGPVYVKFDHNPRVESIMSNK